MRCKLTQLALFFLSASWATEKFAIACTVDPVTNLCIVEAPPPPGNGLQQKPVDPNAPPPVFGTGACAKYSGLALDFCKDAVKACASRPPNLAEQVCVDAYVDAGIPVGPKSPNVLPITQNRAEDWTGKKFNSSLFEEDTTNNLQLGSPNGVFVDQSDSFTNHSSMLVSCAATSIAGRTDFPCSSSPNDPECTGMSKALGNAVVCAVYGPPKANGTRPCLAYGSFGYSIEEWMVFGQQFFDGMNACFLTKEGGDKSDERKDRMNGLVDFASLPEFPGGTPSGPATNGASTITGKVGDDPVLKNKLARAVASKYDDGAGNLGYERGELIRRAVKGQSFLSAFTDSPFAEMVGATTKGIVETALGNATEVMDKVKERRIARGEDIPSEKAPPDSSSGKTGRKPTSLASGLPNEGKSIQKGEPSSLSADGRALSSSSRSRDLAAARALLGETSSPGRKAPAQQLEIEQRGGTSPAPTQSSLGAEGQEATLFQRISLSYRRYAPKLRNLDSSTARDVQLTERPEFFRDL